jgi:hypothetical protein
MEDAYTFSKWHNFYITGNMTSEIVRKQKITFSQKGKDKQNYSRLNFHVIAEITVCIVISKTISSLRWYENNTHHLNWSWIFHWDLWSFVIEFSYYNILGKGTGFYLRPRLANRSHFIHSQVGPLDRNYLLSYSIAQQPLKSYHRLLKRVSLSNSILVFY